MITSDAETKVVTPPTVREARWRICVELSLSPGRSLVPFRIRIKDAEKTIDNAK